MNLNAQNLNSAADTASAMPSAAANMAQETAVEEIKGHAGDAPVVPKKTGFMSGLKTGLGNVGSNLGKGVGAVGSGLGKGVGAIGSGLNTAAKNTAGAIGIGSRQNDAMNKLKSHFE